MNLHASSLQANPKRRAEFLASLSSEESLALIYEWKFWARESQLAPAGDWVTWLLLAGRGFGKTRTGAEWVREQVESSTARRIALIGPTAADARDVMIEGESGILAISAPWNRPNYEPSKRRLTWSNGAIATAYSAEEPERLRGPQHDAAWCDELAAWAYPETWDMLQFGLRLGKQPRTVVTTTPKPLPIIRELLAAGEASVAVTRGRTSDNLRNLAPSFLKRVVAKYQGTRLGRQELDAEVIEEAEGALWTRTMIDGARACPPPREFLKRAVVAIDPAVSSGGLSALTGIVAAGVGRDDRGYLLADVSGRYSPAEWAKKAVKLYDDLKADRIVAEGNQGGEMVRHTIETERKNIPVRIVHASQSKQARAEPVAALSEQKRISFCGTFPELEDQLCTWVPLEGLPSPDRLDAMVWAFTDLMLGSAQDIGFAKPIVVTGPLPGV